LTFLCVVPLIMLQAHHCNSYSTYLYLYHSFDSCYLLSFPTRRSSDLFLGNQGVGFAVAEVARRGANELGNLVGVLKFRAIYLDDRAGIPKQDLRRRFDDAGLSRARRPEKEEVSYGAARRVQSGTEDLVHVDQGLYTFLLANNLGAQGTMKIPRIVAAYGWVQLVADSSSHRLPLLRV